MSGLFDKAKEALSKSGSSSTGAQQPAGNTGATGASGQEDYVDKGLDAAEKKFGYNVSRENNEKITDAGRSFYEKQSGSKVPEKYSN